MSAVNRKLRRAAARHALELASGGSINGVHGRAAPARAGSFVTRSTARIIDDARHFRRDLQTFIAVARRGAT